MKLKKRMNILAGLILMDVVLGMVLILVSGSCIRENWKYASADGEIPEPKVVALTFDDGPNAEYTEILLDGLKKRGVKASFFLIGQCMEGNEAIVRRIHEEGHLLGVHCMQHTQLTKLKVEDAVEQLEETLEKIEEVTGKRAEYVRPPFGAWNTALDEAVHETLGMELVLWDVDSMDWELRNQAAIVKNVVRDVEDGDIILLHDAFGTSVDAAFEIIDILSSRGYTFVTVNELMVD